MVAEEEMIKVDEREGIARHLGWHLALCAFVGEAETNCILQHEKDTPLAVPLRLPEVNQNHRPVGCEF